MEKFFSTELLFTNPNEVAAGIQEFLNTTPVVEIYSVSNFITAVQAPRALHLADTQPNGGVQYQFRFIVVYSAEITQ